MSADPVISRLRSHELGLRGSYYRSSLKVLRSLIKDKSSGYVLVWHVQSKQPIYFEDHKIYLDNFTAVYSLWGVNGKPSVMYRQPEKVHFEDVIIQTTKVNRLPLPGHLFAPLLAGLTRDNRLLRYNASTGAKLDTIFLGLMYKFNNLSWQVTGETLLLQSVYFKKAGFPNPSCLQAVAFVDVNPFKFVALVELTTEMFGSDAKNANVGEDILIIGSGSGAHQSVRLYSMTDVLSDRHSTRLCSCDFSQQCDRSSQSHGLVGAEGFGLPVTHVITSLPPVLFCIKTPDQLVNFGGFPMHYMYELSHRRGVFNVMNLMTDKLVEQFDFRNTTHGEDKCLFHNDESGRIMYFQADALNMFKFCDITKCEVKVSASPNKLIPKLETGDTYTEVGIETQFVLRPVALATGPPTREENVNPNTSRPRRAAASRSYDTLSRAYADGHLPARPLFDADYENETDFLSLLGVAQEDQSSSICLFENSDGSLVKRVSIPELEEEADEYKMVVDLDHIVLIKKKDNKHTIWIYQLTRAEESSRISKPRKTDAQGGDTRIDEVEVTHNQDRKYSLRSRPGQRSNRN